jgi:hypothetical protein
VNKCRFGDSTEIITYETLAEESNNKYHELVGVNQFRPAIRTKTSHDDTPVAMIAQVQKAITDGVLKDLKKSSFGKQGSTKSDTKKKAPSNGKMPPSDKSDDGKHKKDTGFHPTFPKIALQGVINGVPTGLSLRRLYKWMYHLTLGYMAGRHEASTRSPCPS